jgi:hypothetical protein
MSGGSGGQGTGLAASVHQEFHAAQGERAETGTAQPLMILAVHVPERRPNQPVTLQPAYEPAAGLGRNDKAGSDIKFKASCSYGKTGLSVVTGRDKLDYKCLRIGCSIVTTVSYLGR